MSQFQMIFEVLNFVRWYLASAFVVCRHLFIFKMFSSLQKFFKNLLEQTLK